jgi:hypothetical protein
VNTDTRRDRPEAGTDASRSPVDEDGRVVEQDYFTDAVPLVGESERRERDERIRRLEAARPRRSRMRPPRPRAGLMAVLAVMIGAGVLAILGRSDHRSPDPVRPAAVAPVKPAPRPQASARTIGVAPAAPVATFRPQVENRKAGARRRHRQLGNRGRGRSGATGAAELTDSDVEPDSPTPEVTVESAPATVPAPEPAPEPEAAPAAKSEPGPQSGAPAASDEADSAKSSSSEADRQFGFGR